MAEGMRGLAPRPGVKDIPPYVVGGSRIAGAERVIKLSANENPWGPSPQAVEAFRAASHSLADYPAADSAPLREAIGEVHGLDPARIVCGNGSDELLQLLGLAYLEDGDEVLYSRHGFLLYPSYAKMNGARPIAVPETALRTDVEAILAACTDRTRLVYIANPNNPTGTRLSAAELTRLADGIPERALLVLDAAYAEFVTAPDYDGGIALSTARPNVVMTRTFSKIYGLASLRVGWLHGPADVLDILHRVRGPYNLNGPAQAAAAAAMRDTKHTAWCQAETIRLRGFVTDALHQLGIETTASEGNFILVAFGEDPATGAAAVDAYLKSRGIIIRRMDGYGLAGHLRISIGDEAACRAVTEAIAAFRGGA